MKKKKILISILLIFLIFMIYNFYINSNVYVTRFTVTSEKLPKDFDGFRIVQISDLHNAEFGNENSIIVEKVKNEQPDIIVITGDIVDSTNTNIDIAVNLCKKLNEIAPTYYVTGNHESRIGNKLNDLLAGIENSGVILLRNKNINIVRNGFTIDLIGVDDPMFMGGDYFFGNSIDLTKYNSNNFKILLSHRPELFDDYVKNFMNVVFTGHAHGGQFRIPFIGGIIAPDQGFLPKYDSGIYSEKETNMIVSRGIGNSIIPIRINNAPEIISVELKNNN